MVSSVQLISVSSMPPVGGPAAATNVQAAPAPSGGTTISASAQLLSKLQQLAGESPSKFEAIAASASQGLRALAGQASGPQSQTLSRLADAFAQAGSTGDLSALHALAAAAASAGQHHRHGVAVRTAGEGAVGANPTPASPPGATAQTLLEDVSEQVDEAMGMAPPPLGPWFAG
jgi:hypothetical protein